MCRCQCILWFCFEFLIFQSEVVSFDFWGTLCFHPWRTFWVHPWSICWFHSCNFTGFFWWDEMRTFFSLVCLYLKLFWWNNLYWLYFRLWFYLLYWYLVNVSLIEKNWRYAIAAICLSAMFFKWWHWCCVFNEYTSLVNAIVEFSDADMNGITHP